MLDSVVLRTRAFALLVVFVMVSPTLAGLLVTDLSCENQILGRVSAEAVNR